MRFTPVRCGLWYRCRGKVLVEPRKCGDYSPRLLLYQKSTISMKRKSFCTFEIASLFIGLCVYYSPIIYSAIRKTVSDAPLCMIDIMEIWLLVGLVILLDFCIGWMYAKVDSLRDLSSGEVSDSKSFIANIWSLARSQYGDGDVIDSIIKKNLTHSKTRQLYIIGHALVFMISVMMLSLSNGGIGVYQIPLYATLAIVAISALGICKLF